MYQRNNVTTMAVRRFCNPPQIGMLTIQDVEAWYTNLLSDSTLANKRRSTSPV